MEETSVVFGAGLTFRRRETTDALQYPRQFSDDHDGRAYEGINVL